jgi:hypothetical protein
MHMLHTSYINEIIKYLKREREREWTPLFSL